MPAPKLFHQGFQDEFNAMILGTGTWLGYIILKTGSFQEIADPLFYRAATYGGLMSFVSYVAVTLIRYKNIPPVKLPSEYPPDL